MFPIRESFDARTPHGPSHRAICYAVRSRALNLRSIVLNRAALRRLLTATNGAVKIE